MPKLKNALQAHQTQAAIQAAKRKAEENRQQQQQAKSRPGDAGPSSKKRKHASTSDPRSKLAAGPRSTLPSLAKSAKTTTAPPPVAARKAPKPTIPFDHLDTILLLGEANFSFTRSLLRAPHNLSGHMICATSYDPREVCLKKYPDAAEILAEIEGKGVRVVFGVDAGDLPSSVTGKGKGKERQRWSKVVFNFPHAGAGIKDQDRNILTNQHLLLRTLRCVHPILTSGPLPAFATKSSTTPSSKKRKRKGHPVADGDDDVEEPLDGVSDLEDDPDAEEADGLPSRPKTPAPTSFTPPNRTGSILITLLDQPPYTLWALPKLAKSPPEFCPGTRLPQPRFTLLRSFAFVPAVYDGYSHRRTIGFKDGVSKGQNEEITGRRGGARTWEFCRREEDD